MGLSRTLVLTLFSILALFTRAFAQNSPQDYVATHNAARVIVGVGLMTWDNTVAAYAQDYANQRKDDCNLVHSRGPYGENIFWGPRGAAWTAADAVKLWFDERQFYDYNSNTCQDGQQCGHNTQVVWRDSVNLGCARVQCDNGHGSLLATILHRATVLGNGLTRSCLITSCES